MAFRPRQLTDSCRDSCLHAAADKLHRACCRRASCLFYAFCDHILLICICKNNIKSILTAVLLESRYLLAGTPFTCGLLSASLEELLEEEEPEEELEEELEEEDEGAESAAPCASIWSATAARSGLSVRSTDSHLAAILGRPLRVWRQMRGKVAVLA